MLPPDDIDWIQADGDYVRVYVAGKSHLVRHTIGALEERLDASLFARIHRSTIVNISRVREVRPEGDRAFQVVLRDGTVLRMSRGYRTRLTV
jgi:two-component system LytT family response regulator